MADLEIPTEKPSVPTPVFDQLPEKSKKDINTHVIAKTKRQIGDGTLGINDPAEIEAHMLREIERLAKDPKALKLELREEELISKFDKLSPEQRNELAKPNKHTVTGGTHVDYDPKKPCVNTPAIICVDGHGYTKG